MSRGKRHRHLSHCSYPKFVPSVRPLTIPRLFRLSLSRSTGAGPDSLQTQSYPTGPLRLSLDEQETDRTLNRVSTGSVSSCAPSERGTGGTTGLEVGGKVTEEDGSEYKGGPLVKRESVPSEGVVRQPRPYHFFRPTVVPREQRHIQHETIVPPSRSYSLHL